MTRLTGGELVVRTLQAAGVDTVFGIISVHNIPIYDAIGRLGGIRPVPVRHEQAAVAMADGYARATGRLGVAITSTGPGAASGMGTMIEAYWGCSPVLHLTGQIESQYLGKAKGFIHEAKNQLGMLEATSKWAGRPSDTADIPKVLEQAITQALTGRPGPVSVEIPIDLQYFDDTAEIPVFGARARPEPAEADLRRAAEIIAAARRPLIWAGGGVIASGAAAELQALAERLGAGVITSITGRGSLPEDHPLCVGPRALEDPVRELLKSADLLIAVGTRFQGYNTQNWRLELPKTIVHVDVEPATIGLNYPTTQGVVGDAKVALARLLTMVDGVSSSEEWTERAREAGEASKEAMRSRLGPHNQIMDDLREILPREAVVVKDSTIPGYTWGNRLLEVYEPRTAINTASVAIGPGYPLALGAAVGRPDRPVVCIAGDGGFVYNVAELATAVQERLKVVALIFNDGGYEVLRNIQDTQFEGRRMASVDLHTPDFVKLADAYGMWARKVGSVDHFGSILDEALSAAPSLVELDCRAIGPMAVPFSGTSRRPTRPS